MKNTLYIAFAFAGICAAQIPGGGPALQAPPIPNLINQAIDSTHRVLLSGNTRPEAIAKSDLGPVGDSFFLAHMHLLLKRSAAQEATLEAFIADLHNPQSASYHQWITATQFGERYGLSGQDLSTIEHWLQSQGFTVNVVYPNGVLDFSGTAGQVRAAFATEIHNLNVHGTEHIANMTNPTIPAALAPAVAGIVSLNDFWPKAQHVSKPQYTINGGNAYLVVPADLATIYNINPLFNTGNSGQGQTIVLIEDSYLYSTADWTTFRDTFGLSSYTAGSLKQQAPAPATGVNNCVAPAANGDDGEAALDVEMATAAAPSATLVLAACANTNTTWGAFLALENLLSQPSPPPIMSLSYGTAETLNGSGGNAFVNNLYQLAVTEGVSIFVSSGDDGADLADSDITGDNYATLGIGVNGLGSTQYNVSVGGTDFADSYLFEDNKYWGSTNTTTYGSALSYIPEIPWNNSCASLLLALNVGGTVDTVGFCNSTVGQDFLSSVAASGGPSGCATGNSSVEGVVSGTCAGWPKPSWQSVVGNPNDGVRDLPDVALFAANGMWGHYYALCWSDTANGGAPCSGPPDGWSGMGGTSASAPVMAGIQALANQYSGSRWGNPNTVYYNVARSQYGPSGNATCNSDPGGSNSPTCAFHDVTLGDMDTPCLAGSFNCYAPSGTFGVLSTSTSTLLPAFKTGIGWDFATGIGSVNAYNLVTSFVAKNSYTLTVSVSPAGSGSITPSSGSYTAGTSVPITAYATSGYVFAGFSGALTGMANPQNLTMNGNETVVANFTPLTYTLTTSVSPAGGGLIVPTSSSYPSGTNLQVSAQPLTGYVFTGFTGDLTGTNYPQILTMNGNKTVTANFAAVAPLSYGLVTSVSPPGSGTVTPGNGNSYAPGTSVAVTATPNNGFIFAGFTVNLTGMTNPQNIVMNSDKTVVANFVAVGSKKPPTHPYDFAGTGRSGAIIYDSNVGQEYTALANVAAGSFSYVGNLYSPNFDTLRMGDYNGDGMTDLILYNSKTASAYIGMSKGDGTFAFQSLFWSLGYDVVEVGDINGDGKADVALYNSTTGTLYTGISNGDGTFSYTYHLVSKGFTYIRLADYSGDGDADLFLYNSDTGAAYFGVGDGTGNFTFYGLSVSPGYKLVETGDINGDGKMDVFLYNPANGNAATGISTGTNFTFTGLTYSPGFTTARLGNFIAFNNTADLVLYNKNTATAYFGTPDGNGGFSFVSLFWSPGYDSVVAEDVTGSGLMDVVLYNSTTGTEYTGLSNGNGTFTYTYSYWGIGKVLAR